ncbi:hypothetical protein diail_6035 [Diaporthe ilicicola]|nr:hypothetical protein diail_6035 [Diaporthe ilicicola]
MAESRCHLLLGSHLHLTDDNQTPVAAQAADPPGRRFRAVRAPESYCPVRGSESVHFCGQRRAWLFFLQHLKQLCTSFQLSEPSLQRPRRLWRSGSPQVLYTLSASSQSLGAYNLDILPCLMLSQVKLILTPVFSRTLLKQFLQPHQWLCLFVMTTGMLIVQLGSEARSFGRSRADDAGKDMTFVIVSMLVVETCSVFAGVYMEAVLKSSEQNLSFMVRNTQLAAYTCLCALGGLMWQSDLDIEGCFRGYSISVWILVLLQATGGNLVSWAVRIASTIAKNYAQSLGFLAALAIPLVLSPHPMSIEVSNENS